MGFNKKYNSKEDPQLKDTDPMPFGKYKGTAMVNVPASYLLWVKKNVDRNTITQSSLDYIEDNL
jgi:hypothetical protein